MKGACQAAVKALRWWHCNVLYNTHTGTPCMAELTAQGTHCRQRLAGKSQCDIIFVHWPFQQLFLWVLVIGKDPRALLRSMFLDISSFWTDFSQTNFIFSCKIINFIKPDNQFPFISQNNKIAEAPSNPLPILPFNRFLVQILTPCMHKSSEYSDMKVVLPDPVGPVKTVSSPLRCPFKCLLSRG